MLLADESSGDSSEVSCFDFWKRLTIKDAMYMVSDAWNDAIIRASWKKLLGGNQLTTSTGDSGKQSLEEESPVREMLQALGCLEECTDCDETNVEEWLRIDASDPGYAILSDDEIVQTVTNPETVDTDDSDLNELHDVEPTPSHAKACEMLKECILWAEQQPKTTGTHMISLSSLMGISAKKRMSSLKQTKITSFFL